MVKQIFQHKSQNNPIKLQKINFILDISTTLIINKETYKISFIFIFFKTKKEDGRPSPFNNIIVHKQP